MVRGFPVENRAFLMIPDAIWILSVTQDEIVGELFNRLIVHFIAASLWENTKGTVVCDTTSVVPLGGSDFVSRRYNHSHHSKNHWRSCKQTSPFASISITGSMCSQPPRQPPKHPPHGLPGPTRRSSEDLGRRLCRVFFALPDVRPFTQPIPTPSIRRSQPICDVFRGDIGPPWRFMQGVGVFGELRQTLFTFWDRVFIFWNGVFIFWNGIFMFWNRVFIFWNYMYGQIHVATPGIPQT